jgi:hypothetical protein
MISMLRTYGIRSTVIWNCTPYPAGVRRQPPISAAVEAAGVPPTAMFTPTGVAVAVCVGAGAPTTAGDGVDAERFGAEAWGCAHATLTTRGSVAIAARFGTPLTA